MMQGEMIAPELRDRRWTFASREYPPQIARMPWYLSVCDTENSAYPAVGSGLVSLGHLPVFDIQISFEGRNFCYYAVTSSKSIPNRSVVSLRTQPLHRGHRRAQVPIWRTHHRPGHLPGHLLGLHDHRDHQSHGLHRSHLSSQGSQC